ncbi:hypothetical protein PAXINDRAFT_11430 [Paxillus involutus ATCC 200175]|uniref:GDT1 family protein n=1 Tax=Paxillus involutus ATCC 200175 TaxID=664439 RepID=A0A0C9U8Z6_PAXIN|nr:hypothetical protein PAXINDRAFT_11430 [Paxillus involutus ATCC 200175]
MEGRAMKGGNDKIQEEMREAAEEIEGDDAEIDGTGVLAPDGNSIPLERLEEGGARHPTHTRQTTKKPKVAEGARNFCNFLLGPVFVQAFVLTFLGEWGDRSQIATIALGATHDVYLVTIGTVIGHTCCTTLAVLAGRYLSTKLSVKYVTLGGATLFLIFGVIYLYESLSISAEEFLIPIASDQVSGV